MKIRYYLQGGFAILIGLLMFSTAAVCTAEEITLTTYYPSPYGVYSEMRLAPKNNPTACSGTQEGLMFYSDGSNPLYSQRGMYVCGSGGWQPLGGGFWTQTGSNLYPNNNSWNVGIGTTSPAAKFQITSSNADVGSFYFGAALGPPSPLGATRDISFDGGTGSQFYFNNFGPDSTGETGFLYRNNPILIMKNSGNVGIGTTNPNAKLHVNGDMRMPYNGRFKFGNTDGFTDGGGGEWIGNTSPDGSTNFGFRFYSGGLERMRIASNGNVGIGTTNPQAKLHVLAPGVDGIMLQGGIGWGDASLSKVSSSLAPDQGGSMELGAIMTGDARLASVNPVSGGIPYIDMHYGNGLAEDYNVRIINNGNNMLTLQTRSAGYVMTVNGSNVGIGTTNPYQKLHIVGGAYAPLYIETTPGNGADLLVKYGGSNEIVSIGSWTAGGIHFYSTCCGYTNPADGSIILYPRSGDLVIKGNAWKPGGGSWAASSDERLKTNISPIIGALEKITSLKGVNFEWKNPGEHSAKTNEIRAGFLAQEVEKIFPQFISEIDASGKDKELTPDGKIKSLALPFDFDAYLVEAIKEQQGQIEELKAEIGALKTEAGELKTKR